jgi:hypothetical protein
MEGFAPSRVLPRQALNLLRLLFHHTEIKVCCDVTGIYGISSPDPVASLFQSLEQVVILFADWPPQLFLKW